MEKIIYTLWRPENTARDQFNDALRAAGKALVENAHAVRLNIQDTEVEGGASPRAVSTIPQMEAMVQLWVDAAEDAFRSDIDAIIGAVAPRYSAWLVSEATPIANTKYVVKTGERTPGFSQMVFLGRPPRLSWEAWREAWQVHHTEPAINTQSNFEYHQNLIIRPLTYGAPAYAAIVEECFPEEARLDPQVYFDAGGDPEKYQANLKTMMESVARFIDHSRMDCIPTSQYDLKRLFD
ncbi:MAG: EthD domain-containing protein [Pseudomonadota bacterium]